MTIMGTLRQGYINLCKVIHLTAVEARIETRSPVPHHAVYLIRVLNVAFKTVWSTANTVIPKNVSVT